MYDIKLKFLEKGIKEIDFTVENFKKILLEKTFKDLRFGKLDGRDIIKIDKIGGYEIYYLKNYSTQKLLEILKNITSNVFFKSFTKGSDGNIRFFSFHLPVKDKSTGKIYYQGFRGVIKFSVAGVEVTIRQLIKKAKVGNLIKDNNLLDLVLKGMTSKKSLIISGRPGAGKSTILISLLEYFNNNTYNSLLTELYFKLIKKIIFQRNFEKLYITDKKKIKELINTLDSLKIEEEILEKILKTIEFVTKEYFFYKNKNSVNYLLHDFITELNNILEGKKNSEIGIEEFYLENKEIFNLILKINKIFEKELLAYFEILKLNDPLLKGIEKFNKLGYKNINTLENPVEYIFDSNYLIFYQHDVGVHLNND